MSSRDDGAPEGVAVTEELRPEVMPRHECDGCLVKRFGVRTYVVAGVAKRDLCPRCSKAMGAELVAPEATTRSIIDIAVSRVELVEARAVKCHCERCRGLYTVAEHRSGVESLAVLTAATERAELPEPHLSNFSEPLREEIATERLAATVGAGRAPEGDLPFVWPDPEVVS